jgi:acetyl-CoA carboxylase biotin carboxylase subunit
MSPSTPASPARTRAPIAVEVMRTLLVCRGPIAFETLEIYRQRGWQLPHVVVSSREWIAELQRTAPWIIDLPSDHVHYVQEYNDVEAILALVEEYHIDAVYAGYGFLAESADFAECVEQAGARFIGPTPQTLRAVGDKDTAIALARQLGIPTIPGDDALIAFAQTHRQDEIAAEAVVRTLALAQRSPGYPIRLKHPAGGGGKGQRVLAADVLQGPEAEASIRDALTKVWSEMGVSPGAADVRKGVLLEVDLPQPLHWEVQIFGDGERVVHFAARDCSLQNHGYQKFIEVALHPQAIAQEIAKLDTSAAAARIASLQRRQATLERICADALRLGMTVHLRGAATVEFLVDQQGEPYFLEVNPRIQVEHGVTEGILRVRGHAISLVELQQRVAAGEKLTFHQDDITFVGDAIEVRLNAWHEDLSPVLGGVVHQLRLTPAPALAPYVRLDAGGLLQRRQPWIVPSYDANFALLIVTGSERHETLTYLITVLEGSLEIRGNTELKTNVQPIIGLLTLMRALPPETEFRTDVSQLWTSLTAVVATQKQTVLSQVPDFPRRPGAHDPAVLARLLRATLEAGFAHPSRLLTYYLKRLTCPDPRPLAPVEVLWQLAAELAVPLYEEERAWGVALQQAIEALWRQLAADSQRLYALVQAATTQSLETSPEYQAVCAHLVATTPGLDTAEAAALLRYLLDWLRVDIPAITALVTMLEHTHIHACLAANDDLSLTRPAYLDDATTVAHLHRLLSSSLRPTLLRQGELLSPMEATIYHQPEPGASPFVEIGAEIKVGQPLALLEAMKMFSELPSPVDGVLVAILVENGQGVKTGTPLFRIATQDALHLTADADLYHMVEAAFENHFGLLSVKHE